MMIWALYTTRSRSTNVGTEWYGLSSLKSSGSTSLPTSMTSTVMPFSANTSRTRWLCGHTAREYSVITGLRLPVVAMSPPHRYYRRALRDASNPTDSGDRFVARHGRWGRLYRIEGARWGCRHAAYAVKSRVQRECARRRSGFDGCVPPPSSSFLPAIPSPPVCPDGAG